MQENLSINSYNIDCVKTFSLLGSVNFPEETPSRIGSRIRALV